MKHFLSKTPIFRWKGISSEGLALQGEVVASNQFIATAQLLSLNIQSLKISRGIFLFRPKKILTSPLRILLTEQLAELLTSGLSLSNAFNIMSKDFPNVRARTLLWILNQHINNGQTLAETLNYFSHEFSMLYRQLINIGENSGQLEKTLYRLVELEQKKQLMKQKFQKASSYPCIVMIMTFLMSGFLLMEIVPQFADIFDQAHVKLPWMTNILLKLSQFLVNQIYPVILLIIILTLIYGYCLKAFSKVKKQSLQVAIMMPVFGKIVKAFYLMHFSYSTAIFLQAGVPLSTTLESFIKYPNNPLLTETIQKLLYSVNLGQSLSESIALNNFFPMALSNSLQIGEVTGSMPQTLLKAAYYYETMIDKFLDNASVFMEPILMIFLGVIVSVFVVALYLPIFQLGSVLA